MIDGPDYSPSPNNYVLTPSSLRSCLGVVIRSDLFYEDVETLTGTLVALVNENGVQVDSIRGVILDPIETEIRITDIDGMY